MGDRSVWLLRRVITLAVAAVAMFAVHSLWNDYEVAPWTGDGRVRADVVSIAPDVPGLVVRVAVHDNELVSKGDALFELDRSRYEIALQQGLATVARQRASLAEAGREAHRNDSLGEVVASEVREQSRTRVHEATAELQRGLADLAAARLNLQRTLVVAPVKWIFINLDLRPRTSLTEGRMRLAHV